MTETGLELIKDFEGFQSEPYLCPGGYWTIGYGHVIHARDRLRYPITREQAEQLLRKDVRVAEAAVIRLITVSLSAGQCDALVSFTFNLGAGALQRSTLRRKLNRGEYEAVPEEFMRWVFAGGRRLAGLVRRRRAEVARYRAEA